ncbi:hypothetical protein SAMN05444287_0905 [Octadecabacter temperatus]|uniref:Uncharacterized protein n=1 Tax=Octadecabacter temperatus TaxID=1458307 RepID=A0A0K0Y4L6_9RHOB|nr:hypothetical protein [Octadecabacter temperatus]AKS45806.1 hypothetical protein OSB_12510 [Octadecabacter temperatus]SIO00949.1 hypothetical protein SAMN05444287_0905 [Octadecabacter temperatus]
MTLDKIENACREHAPDGPYDHLFRIQDGAHQCVLFPSRLLTVAEFEALQRRLSGPVALTPEDRRRNDLRARASLKDGDRRYG